MADEKKVLPALFDGINKVKDEAAPTDLEKKHTPVITSPDKVAAGACFEVTVEIGKLLAHPNEVGHYIGWIELYAGDVLLARQSLAAVRTCPALKVCVNLDKRLGDLRALTYCNLHGTWEDTKKITVE